MDYYLFVFENTHWAMTGEKYLSAQMAVTVMPTLREISKSCGISLRVEPALLPQAVELMKQSAIPPEMVRLYGVEKVDGKNTIAQVEW